MRLKKHETTGSGDLFRARLDQIINMRHELVQLAGEIDWEFIDGEIAPLYSDGGRPGIATQFVGEADERGKDRSRDHGSADSADQAQAQT